jgi:hypothetical protein
VSHQVCHEVGEWISSNVTQEVERCVERDCNWWCLCCNKWFCFLVWVVVTVVSWVVTTVCEIVEDAVDLVVNVITGLVDVFVGIVTGDWTRVLAGFGKIVGGVVAFVLDVLPILTGGTLVGAFDRARRKWELRNFARALLEAKYGAADPEGFARMLDALGIESGGFGLRLDAMALRSFIRSDFSSRSDGVPDLIGWLSANSLDLKALAGFNPPAWWDRGWPELVPDNGSLTAADLDDYVAKGGQGKSVKHFSLFSMGAGDVQTHLSCADTHASELGLVFRWTPRNAMLMRGRQVLINRGLFASILADPPFSRSHVATNPAAASSDLAMPMVIGSFGFSDGGMGISAHLAAATCLEPNDAGSTAFPGQGMTGAAFRYRKPDLAFKYTAIHELGHAFGLCHADGLLRIMYTNADGAKKSIWSGSSAWQYWTNGIEAGFTLDEGKKTWEYIVANLDGARLQTRAF